MTKKELFANANGLELDDPILDTFNEKTGDLQISKELRLQLARGLYNKTVNK